MKYSIALADLRHKTVGRHSSYMPIAIGYVGSYAKSLCKDQTEFSLFTDSDKLVPKLKTGKVDILGLSNYIWNADLSSAVAKFAKSINPKIITIAGGPEFPTDNEEIQEYLIKRSELDFYVFNYEGEISFGYIIREILNGTPIEKMKSNPPPGVASLDKNNKLCKTNNPPRLKELDEIPSPILSGMMDEFFNGEYMPFIETTRGCPYACTYCVQGTEWYNKIHAFSTERISQEFEYIAKKMINHKNVPLALSDSNFGMYKRDETTAEILSSLADKYGYPNSFIVDTGKSQIDRLIIIAKKLKNLNMSISPQSFNPATLKALKRKNLGETNLSRVYDKFKENNIPTHAAIICPLPEETRESYIEGLRSLSESEVNNPLAYTTMMLKGTDLAAKATRKKYNMKTKYRLLPRQFSIVDGRRVFEFDEVCIETNTMTYEEYIECRGASFLFLALSVDQFDYLRRICEEIEVKWFDLFLKIWDKIGKDKGPSGDTYKQFIQASHDEVFASEEAIQEFINIDENFNKLIDGTYGENVMRNFVPKLSINYFKLD